MPSIPLPAGLARGGVTLRRLRGRDAGPLVQAFRDDPGLGPAIGVEHDPTEAAARRSIAGQARLRARGIFLGLAVSDVTQRPFLGHVMLHSFDWDHRRAELGYWLVPAVRGRGLGRAAAGALADWALAELPLDRLEVTTTPDNVAALALAEALGFHREGVLRGRNLERGRRIDVVVLGRLRESGDGSRLSRGGPVA